MRVRVFRNLTHRALSIQVQVVHPETNRKAWRTVLHASAVRLTDVRFVVSEAGRQRVLRTGKKTVHAFAEGVLEHVALVPSGRGIRSIWTSLPDGVRRVLLGRLVPLEHVYDADTTAPVTYDPRRFASFVVRETGEPIRIAPAVTLSTSRGVLAALED